MILYRTSGNDGDDVRYKWSGSKLAAKEQRDELKADGYNKIESTLLELPTAKDELLAWLNENVKMPMPPEPSVKK